MKKIKKYVLLFAGLVIAFTGFTACASDGEESLEPDNPETLGEAIKAQFTISIPMQTGKATRQGSDVVQYTADIDNFRGINEIKLYPSALASTTASNTFATTANNIGNNISLSRLMIPEATLITSNSIPNKKLLAESNSVLYGDVQLQIGTRMFLFYGAAIGKGKQANDYLKDYAANDKIINGHLAISGLADNASDVSTFEFSPSPIIDPNEETTVTTARTTKQERILAYLKQIAGTTDWSTSTNEGFKKLYQDFTGKKSETATYLMAGSSKSLEAAIEDLYFTLINNTDPLAQAICSNIYSGTEDENVTVTNTEETKTLVFKDALAGYPSESDNLPDGAAVIQWTGSQPSYVSTGTANEYVSEMNVTKIGSYAYPACLYYWGKSGILTAETSKSSLFDGSNKWSEITTATNFDAGPAITSKTRSVVLLDPVNYAVGRLDILVVYPADITKFPDRGKDNKSYVNVGDIKLTGILIGGQKTVDWQFLQKSGGDEYIVYDNITKSTTNTDGLPVLKGTTDNLKNYVNSTLVLESAGKVGDVEDKVNVALEFVNNGGDFYGKQGIVPKGTKFYLVGSLDAGNAAEIAKNADESSSYNNTGGKIFKQDFVTKAQFTIANLKNAYNTVPDMRNPAVELGLSVNLSWQDGIIFQHTFEGE